MFSSSSGTPGSAGALLQSQSLCSHGRLPLPFLCLLSVECLCLNFSSLQWYQSPWIRTHSNDLILNLLHLQNLYNSSYNVKQAVSCSFLFPAFYSLLLVAFSCPLIKHCGDNIYIFIFLIQQFKSSLSPNPAQCFLHLHIHDCIILEAISKLVRQLPLLK